MEPIDLTPLTRFGALTMHLMPDGFVLLSIAVQIEGVMSLQVFNAAALTQNFIAFVGDALAGVGATPLPVPEGDGVFLIMPAEPDLPRSDPSNN